jgi:hypothetical protein
MLKYRHFCTVLLLLAACLYVALLLLPSLTVAPSSPGEIQRVGYYRQELGKLPSREELARKVEVEEGRVSALLAGLYVECQRGVDSLGTVISVYRDLYRELISNVTGILSPK